MLHFETHIARRGAKVSAFWSLRGITVLSDRVGKVEGDNLHLLRTVENPVWKQTLHQDAEPAECNSCHHRDSANDRGQHDHSDDQVGDVIPASEVGILVPDDIRIVVDLSEQRFRVAVGHCSA